MSGIINFLKNIVGGIFGFLSGIFSKKTPAMEGASNPPSKKSKSGYFLEFDDSNSAASAVASAVMAPVTQVVDAIASGDGAAPTQAKKSTRKEQLAAAKAASNGNPATVTKAASEPKSVPVETVVTVPSEVGFASKYPIQISGGRRRPGANMNSYLDMARQMK